jgi:RNA polymerase subunit RPABC4/transcription elongation factor Spt4
MRCPNPESRTFARGWRGHYSFSAKRTRRASLERRQTGRTCRWDHQVHQDQALPCCRVYRTRSPASTWIDLVTIVDEGQLWSCNGWAAGTKQE